MKKIVIPGDVLSHVIPTFQSNYELLTRKTEKNIIIFAADHKFEHLNDDFVGPHIPAQVNDPEHIFTIAQQSPIGALATQLGLIARYGAAYPGIPYIAKLNSKTNSLPNEVREAKSLQLWSVDDAIELASNMKIQIIGVGYTIYLGSQDEQAMLMQAAHIVRDAHRNGLIATLWIYPRGKDLENPWNPRFLMGATGIATALGADVVKVQVHDDHEQTILPIACQAAGNTKVLVAGKEMIAAEKYLERVYNLIHTGRCDGIAVGRNIFQRETAQAIKLLHALSAIVYDNKTLQEAKNLL